MKHKIKLHLGCGKRYLPGYIHIDLDSYSHINYVHDIKSLPMFNDNSVDEIYTCGTFEYFDRITEVPVVLSEWKRILKKNSVLRISVPDFKGVIKVYNKYKNLDERGILGPIFGRIEITTSKKILFHKTVYDYKSLCKILNTFGFVNISKYNWKEFLPDTYDDFSKAYIPHMDLNGISLSLNVVCKPKK